MNVLKKSAFVLVSFVLGVCCFVIAEFFMLTTSGDENANYVVVDIENVENLKTNYYLNEALCVDDAKIFLLTDENVEKVADLKVSNVEGFDSSNIGNFEMTISYDDCSFVVPYSVEYKELCFAEDYNFDFELNEQVDLGDYVVNALDANDEVAVSKTLAELEVENFSTEQISVSRDAKIRTAHVFFDEYSFDFDYSVFYFASTQNYAGKSAEIDGFTYEILEFKPNFDGKIKIAKKIEALGLVESVYEYDFKKRLDFGASSSFMTSKAVGNLQFSDKKLTLLKDIVGNNTPVDIFVSRQPQKAETPVYMKQIIGLKNVKSAFYVGETSSFEGAKATIRMSDGSDIELDLTAANFSDLYTGDVGNYQLEVNLFKFNFVYDYEVQYKSLEFYFEEGQEKWFFIFKVGSKEMYDQEIICYSIDGTPVGYRRLSDADVELRNFDVETSSNGFVRFGEIWCHGACLKFEYAVDI